MHCKPVGNGRTALKYLAPYVFRVAISNRRLVKLENDQVTFRYRATDTGQPKWCTLSAEAFIHRFLKHVLPKSFVKVRYFGFFAPGSRKRLAILRNSSSRSTQRTLGSQMPHQCQPFRSRRQSCAALVVASRCFFNETFNPLDVARHEPHWFLPSDFSLDAGFWSRTQTSTRLNARKIHPNRFVAAFFACVGWLIGYTIYSDELART